MDYINIVSWNLDFWKKTCTNPASKYYKSDRIVSLWKDRVYYDLSQLDADFLVLQEINPYALYGKNDYRNPASHDPPVYEFKEDEKNIYYHELYPELAGELKDLTQTAVLWGSAIIANGKYEFVKNYNDNPSYGKFEYYGSRLLMCYTFKLLNDKTITIINHYKKSTPNEGYIYNENFIKLLGSLTSGLDSDFIILAGDFNTSSKDLKNRHVFNEIKDLGFINETERIGSTMINYEYQNDYIFVNIELSKYLENIQKFSQWNISDHYGIRCTIKM